MYREVLLPECPFTAAVAGKELNGEAEDPLNNRKWVTSPTLHSVSLNSNRFAIHQLTHTHTIYHTLQETTRLFWVRWPTTVHQWLTPSDHTVYQLPMGLRWIQMMSSFFSNSNRNAWPMHRAPRKKVYT